jgi:PAS domain-containing protein
MSQAAAPPRTLPSSGTPEAGQAITPVRGTDTGATSRAAIQTWTGKAIGEQIHAKSLDAAYRLWLYHRATRQPRLRDMYSKSAETFGDSVVSLKVGNDHIVVAQSEGYIRHLGQDLRGVRTSELKFATANSLRELYDVSLARKRPIYARYISSLSDQNVYWETLILPLAVDEQSAPIFTISYVAMLNEKIDILQILYDRSPVGIVAAVPIMNGQNKTDDARVLTMNPKAKQILRLEPASSPMHTVGELIRYLGAELRWTGIATAREGQATRVDYRNPEGEVFAMTIELVNQLLLITFAEQNQQQPDVKTTSRFARLLGLG